MTKLGLAVSGLFARGMRTAMMIVSVAIAVGMVVAMTAMTVHIHALQTSWSGDNDYISVRGTVHGKLPIAYVDRIRSIPGADPVAWTTSRVHAITPDRYEMSVHASSAGMPAAVPPAWLKIDKAVADRWAGERRGMIVKQEVAAHFGWHEGQTVTLDTDIGKIEAVVSGLATGECEPRVMLHFEYVDELRKAALPDESGMVGSIWVKAAPSVRSAVADQIEQMFASSPMPVIVQLSSETASAINGAQFNVTDLVTLIAVLATLVTAVVTTNTFFITMRERRAEIGSLRALGFRRTTVLAMILLESIILWSLGAIVGIGFTAGLLYFGNISVSSPGLAPVPFHLDLEATLVGAGVAIVLAVVTAALPGLVAVRVDVVEALSSR